MNKISLRIRRLIAKHESWGLSCVSKSRIKNMLFNSEQLFMNKHLQFRQDIDVVRLIHALNMLDEFKEIIDSQVA